MTGLVVNLDDFRRKVYEQMRCLFCGMRHAMVHAVNDHPQVYYPCPGCDETASVPEWREGLR